jgi:hypothetical protein
MSRTARITSTCSRRAAGRRGSPSSGRPFLEKRSSPACCSRPRHALDIILALTGGGPANATQTIATQAYVVSFREFQFGQGAALSNILVVVSLLFALLYLYVNRRVTAR